MAKKQEKTSMIPVLKEHIQNKDPERLYFFYGEERFLLQHYLDKLQKVIVDELTESFNFHKLTTETFDIQSFADAVENLPMMAERTMVLVDDIDLFKMPEDERSKIVDILSDIPDYCTVVFTFETVEWKPDKRYAKLYNAVSEYGYQIEFPKQSQQDLIAWVTRHFAANKKHISPDLCSYLIEITGGTMTALAGEISKICAFSGSDHIVKSDIDAVTEPVLDAVMFQLTDALGKGRYADALQILQKLLKMQEDPIYLLGVIGSHFRRLGAARTLLDNGRQSNELMKLYNMSAYPAQKTMESARNFRPEFCRKAAELILKTDRQMKTSFDDAERLLELLILQLAQEARGD